MFAASVWIVFLIVAGLWVYGKLGGCACGGH